MPKYIVSVTLETDEDRSDEDVKAAVEQAMLEQWGWVGFEGDPKVAVTAVERKG